MNPYQANRENEILSADPLELVQILYRGALAEIGDARRQLRAGNVAARSRAIMQANSILGELAVAVDHSNGAEVGRNLVELYDYVQRLLNDANYRQVDPPLAEAERLLTTLLEAWTTVSSSQQEEIPAEYEREYEPVSCVG